MSVGGLQCVSLIRTSRRDVDMPRPTTGGSHSTKNSKTLHQLLVAGCLNASITNLKSKHGEVLSVMRNARDILTRKRFLNGGARQPRNSDRTIAHRDRRME